MEEVLQKIGLREEEIKAFIFLLENGSQTAGNLAKKTGLSRPSLYGFVRKLQNLGLVIESQKTGVKTFTASSKDKILSLFNEKISFFEKSKILFEKSYESIQNNGAATIPKFQLFEGKNGLKEVLKDMLLYRDIETKAYWPIKSMVDILSGEFFKELNKERIKQRLYTKAIWPQSQVVDIKKHPYLGAGADFFREIRVAPKYIAFSMGYWIYGNKVAFISSKKESFGFIIESKELVEMLNSQFEVIWKMSNILNAKNRETEDFLKSVG